MVSKKQAVFSQLLREHMARKRLSQRQIASYLGIAAASVSRKLRGLHPWTADEQEKLIRWLHLALPTEDTSPCLADDPVLEAMTRTLLGMNRQTRPEVYKLTLSVMRGLQDHMTQDGQEAYRAFCALVG